MYICIYVCVYIYIERERDIYIMSLFRRPVPVLALLEARLIIKVLVITSKL